MQLLSLAYKLKINKFIFLKYYTKYLLLGSILNPLNIFIFKNFKNMFFFLSYQYMKNQLTISVSKLNFFFFCYGLNNYFLIETFCVFLKKHKKILVLMGYNNLPYLFKILLKRKVFFITCDYTTYYSIIINSKIIY